MTTETETSMRAFRFALDPNPVQLDSMRRHVGNARLAFNFALGMKISAHQEWRDKVQLQIAAGVDEAAARKSVKVRVPGRFDVQKYFNQVRGDNRVPGGFGDPELQGPAPAAPWFHEVGTYAFQAAFADADTAWKNWIDSITGKRAGRAIGYPRFKKKGALGILSGSTTTPTNRLLDSPDIGTCRFPESVQYGCTSPERGWPGCSTAPTGKSSQSPSLVPGIGGTQRFSSNIRPSQLFPQRRNGLPGRSGSTSESRGLQLSRLDWTSPTPIRGI